MMNQEEENEYIWEDLLYHVESGQVIPVIGEDLALVEYEGRQVNAYHLLAEKLQLQESQGADPIMLSDEHLTIRDVVAKYYSLRSSPSLAAPKIYELFNTLSIPIPKSLIELSSISAFKLFFTTSFDPWMEAALKETRGLEPVSLSFTLEKNSKNITKEHVKAHMGPNPNPMVFHLFGRISAQYKDYAITEEDLLEFLHKFQTTPPKNLGDLLVNHSILFIGNSLADWLARFLIRSLRKKRLSDTEAGGCRVFIVDDQLRRNESTRPFFSHFSSNKIHILPNDTATCFVSELLRRCKERGLAISVPGSHNFEIRELELPKSDVFISYASEDKDMALKLSRQLKGFGISAWLDKENLRIGDKWWPAITKAIDNCAVFMPVISNNANNRIKGEFRREWKVAIDDRLPSYKGSNVPHTIPVYISNFNEDDPENVPKEFGKHHLAMTGGELTQDQLREVKRAAESIRSMLR